LIVASRSWDGHYSTSPFNGIPRQTNGTKRLTPIRTDKKRRIENPTKSKCVYIHQMARKSK
jgi:hypothetical protein